MDAVPDAEFVFAEGNPGEDLLPSVALRRALAGAPEYILSMGFRLPRYTPLPDKKPTAELNQASFANFNRLFSRNNLISGMWACRRIRRAWRVCRICNRLLLQASTKPGMPQRKPPRKMYERKKYQPGLKIMAARPGLWPARPRRSTSRSVYLSARSITSESDGALWTRHISSRRDKGASMVRPSTTGRE